MDNYAKVSELFRHTKGAVAQAALVRELDQAGLGGILPGGKPGLSPSEVFRADAKAIGKETANAGILAGKLIKGAGYVVSLGSTERPNFGHGYYEPANSTENVMMRQYGDALSWAIPVPGVGRAVEGAIPRAIEAVGPRAAAQAERSIAGKSLPSSEMADNSISQAASRPVVAEKTGEAPPAIGEGTAAASPPKRKPDFFRQPTSSLDDLYTVAPKWQADLEGAGQQIADEVGAKLVSNGIKKGRRQTKKSGATTTRMHQSSLISSGSALWSSRRPRLMVAAKLAQRYKIRDGKWYGKDNGYFDRKVMVRFEDGTLGEVQMLEPNMYKAKTELGGQDLYTRSRPMDRETPEYRDLQAQETALYIQARRNANPIWREVLERLKVGLGSQKRDAK